MGNGKKTAKGNGKAEWEKIEGRFNQVKRENGSKYRKSRGTGSFEGVSKEDVVLRK